MANKDQTYTIKIEAELHDLSNKISKARNELEGLFKSGNAPKGLISSFEKIENILGRISDKSAQTPSKSLFLGLEKDIGNAQLLFGELTRQISNLKNSSQNIKIELFPPEERKKIESIIASLEEYSRSLDKIKKKQVEVDAAQKTGAKTLKIAREAKDSKTSLKRKKEKEVAKREGIQGRLDALNTDPEKNAVQIAKLSGELKSLDLVIKNLTTDYNAASKALTEANKATQDAEQNYNRLSKELTDLETKELEKMSVVAEKAGVSIEKIDGETASETLERLNKATTDWVNNSLNELPPKLNEANENLKNSSQAFSTLEKETREAAEAQQEFEETVSKQKAFENRIKQFLGLAGAAQVMRHAVRNAVQTISELDRTMTEMSVVTDLSVSDYWDQLPQYTKRANELGLAINDVYKADTLYYQQGLKTNEVMAISTETMKMAQIAGLDTAEATDRMTAALRGFNMELDETNAKRISDVYSELAAITAADVDEISTAMTKTASIASSAGMEFETTAAFLSQIIETTRESAETAGTAMKTVIARFQELKKAPDEIGEIDGEIVDANAIETALRSVGVELRESSGQFRELDDVFLELSSKWDGLDKNTQRYIATIAAGSRQQSRFIAMMSDYARTQELVTSANDSAGASSEQFEKTAESLRFKINRLKNAWEEFTMGILESDLLKFGVDVLTKFLEVVNKATSALNGVGGSIAKIASLLTIFKMGAKIFDKVKKPLVNTLNWFVDTAGMKGYEAGKKNAQEFRRGQEEVLATEETEQTEEPDSEEQPKDEKTLKNYVADKTGVTKIQEGKNEIRQDRQKVYEKTVEDKRKALLQKKAEERDSNYIKAAENFDKVASEYNQDSEEYQKALEDICDAQEAYNHELMVTEDELKLTKEEMDIVFSSGSKGWEKLGQGIQEMGSAATAAGVGISMLGGIFSSLGLEEVGEAFTIIGTAITFVGTAVSIVGTLIPVVAKIAEKAGISVQAAWWWVVAIVAAVAAVVVAVMGISKAVNNASPEKKLDEVKKSAEAAKEAAEEATEAYNGLKDSLEGLKDSQKGLDDLVTGTEAWKEAVSNLNSEILELIQKYPQLAKFVTHKDGVMSIDFDSAGVQAALEEARKSMENANIAATGAELDVLQMQDALAYDALSKKAKISYIDPETAAGLAAAGAYLAGAGAGAGTGAAIGGSIGTVATPVGTIAVGGIGAVLGGAIGAIAVGVTGAADAAGEAAAEAAEAHNEKTQSTVEGIARALANGELVDTGTGYELAEGVNAKVFEAEYGVAIEELNGFYNELSDATSQLKEFGQGLQQTKDQSDKYYDSMAVQIYNGLDKSSWNEETKTMADNILDGASLEVKREEILRGFKDTDMLDKNLDDATKNRINTAVQDTYGANARVVEDKENGGYKIIDGEGNTKLSGVTSDSLKNIVATSEAKKQQQEIGKDMPTIAKSITNAFSSNGGLFDNKYTSEAIEKAIITAFDDESGSNLTEAQLGILRELTDEELTSVFDSSDALKKAFGNVSVFINKLKTPIGNAENAFGQSAATFEKIANTELQDKLENLTSGAQRGLANSARLGAIYATGSAEEITSFESSFAQILSKGNEEAIVAYLNSIDWSDQESLKRAKQTLINEYGAEEEAANSLVNSISSAVDAISSLTILDDVFGDFYKATKKVEDALKKVNDLQWKYERLLKGTGDSAEILTNLEEQRAQYLQSGQEAIVAYNEARKRQAEIYAQGVTKIPGGPNLTQYAHFDPKTNSYDFSGLAELLEGYESNDPIRKTIEEWQKDLVEANNLSNEQIDIAKDSYENLEEINESLKQAYQTLWDQIEETLLSQAEQGISTQKESAEIFQKATNGLINKIQEQIDEQRQQRQEEETENDINKMRSQAAYLNMNSDADLLELKKLEEEIAQAEQEYQDMLVDQSIQELQDSNEKAYEQRERQIYLAEQQLEAYRQGSEFQQNVQSLMDNYIAEYNAYEKEYAQWQKIQDANLLTKLAFEQMYGDISETEFSALKNTIMDKPTFDASSTQLGQMMVQNGVLNGMNDLEKEQYWLDLRNNTANSAAYIKSLDEYSEGTGEDDQAALLASIVENTGLNNLVNYLYSEKMGTTGKMESKFNQDTYFDLAGSSNMEDYKNGGKYDDASTSAMNTYMQNVQKASTHSEELIGSNQRANAKQDNMAKIATALHGKGKEEKYTPLEIGKFYGNLNKGNGIDGDTEGLFTQQTLTDSLVNNIKVDGKDYFVGSYEHYLDWFEAKEQESTYSEIPKSNKRTELEKELGDKINEWQKQPGFKNIRESVRNRAEYGTILNDYLDLGGAEADLVINALKEIGGLSYGIVDGVTVSTHMFDNGIEITGLGNDALTKAQSKSLGGKAPDAVKKAKESLGQKQPYLYNGNLYWYDITTGLSGQPVTSWYQMVPPGEDTGGGAKNTLYYYKEKLRQFELGGLANFTGPAWLDGTKSHPEYILNAAQTERFFSLVDILEKYEPNEKSGKSGDNYFEIEINVEKLENDYDVEKVADKIRRMIYEDASYRNVNAINHIR